MSKKQLFIKIAPPLVLIIVGLGGLMAAHLTRSIQPPATAQAQTVTKAVSTNPCAGNTLANFVLVSISQRRMWACSASTEVYNSPVVTGMEKLPADLTPTGTYTIYAKVTNLYLNGSDSTGSWHDYVNYWMPFLNNQYGTYGFHDATWRPSNAFGNISPDSSNASHGCVEMPLATAKWLYNWAPVGTTVTIKS
ncbi:MAG TPA: L,D-transpeptidase [Candidatus Saccharimonadales bacterium]|nr:L,D-transpeptidase [Candidatus Saccharimonadales bacterium]